jgi:hypothetical protein
MEPWLEPEFRQLTEQLKAHLGKEYPEAEKEQVVETAEAMAAFLAPHFYFKLFEYYRKTNSFEETIEIMRQKLDRDYHQKIFFDKAKKTIQGSYLAWSMILGESLV